VPGSPSIHCPAFAFEFDLDHTPKSAVNLVTADVSAEMALRADELFLGAIDALHAHGCTIRQLERSCQGAAIFSNALEIADLECAACGEADELRAKIDPFSLHGSLIGILEGNLQPPPCLSATPQARYGLPGCAGKAGKEVAAGTLASVCDTQKSMYKRIVLKLSGEALAGPKGFGLDAEKVTAITAELADVHSLGVEIGIVVGGGNFFRGVAEQAREMDRVAADNMGMLSTVINAIALQDALEARDVQCRVMSAVFMNQIAEPYIRRRAVRHLEKGRVVVFAAGIGNPFFSTDTAASLRAMEIKADVLLKGTKVEGVFNADPVHVKDAVKYEEITYMEILKQGLKVMDLTAVSLCKDNNLPMVIFNMNQPGNIRRVVLGEKVGSLVTA
jgi:uridylate kinase